MRSPSVHAKLAGTGSNGVKSVTARVGISTEGVEAINGCVCFGDPPLECDVGLPKSAVLILQPGKVVMHCACFIEPPLARALCACAIGEYPFAPRLVSNIANVVAEPF